MQDSTKQLAKVLDAMLKFFIELLRNIELLLIMWFIKELQSIYKDHFQVFLCLWFCFAITLTIFVFRIIRNIEKEINRY